MPETVPDLNPPPRLLLGPGPINADPRVLRAMSMPILGQFDPVFTGYMDETMGLLRRLYQTDNKWAFLVNGTGRAGIEAILTSLIAPGDRVLVPVFGRFGHLLCEIAARSGGMPLDSSRSCSSLSLRRSSRSRAMLRICRRTVLFQWFLMMLSVRPGSIFAISAHLFPSLSRASRRIRSSCTRTARVSGGECDKVGIPAGAGGKAGHTSSVHGPFLMDGSRLFIQRSRHCLPARPSIIPATTDQFRVPYLFTCHPRRSVSAAVQRLLRSAPKGDRRCSPV